VTPCSTAQVAPRGRDLAIPGRTETAANIHAGVEWLASIWFEHVTRIGRRVVVVGGSNTAIDCARSARWLGSQEVKMMVRSRFKNMKALSWEKDDVRREGVTICNDLVPKEITHGNGRLTGATFKPATSVFKEGKRILVSAGPLQHLPCDDVVIPCRPRFRLRLDRARSRHRLRLARHAEARSGEAAVDASNVLFGVDAAYDLRTSSPQWRRAIRPAVTIELLLSDADPCVRPQPSRCKGDL
jgi:formate dehydrogenase (NADP+) beta subunit